MKNDYKEAMDKRNVDADFESSTINKLKSIKQKRIKRARRRNMYIGISGLAAAACLVFAIFTFSPVSEDSAPAPAYDSEPVPALAETQPPPAEAPVPGDMAQDGPQADYAPLPDEMEVLDDGREHSRAPIPDDSGVPHLVLRAGHYEWALVNLVLSMAGIILAALTLVRLRLQKQNERINAQDEQSPGKNGKRSRRRSVLTAMMTLLAVAGIAMFVLTQYGAFYMVLVDRWTLVHAALFIAAILCRVFALKPEKDSIK